MRGLLLEDVLNDLRVQIGASLSANHNANTREAHVNALRKTQEWLWDDFDWPHLRVERQLPIASGQRFYAPPDDMHIDRIERIQLFSDGCWAPLEAGIDGRHYAAWNSDLNDRSWPPLRWQIAEGGRADSDQVGEGYVYDNEQIELWPISDRNADEITRDGYFKVIGIRNLRPFRDNKDRLDLDDQLVVLYTAAGLVSNPKDAQMMLSRAKRRDARLRGSLSKRTRFNMFSTTGPNPRRAGRPIVANVRQVP